MKKCPKCGAVYEDDKKFCKKCGTALQPVYNISPDKIAEKSVFEEKLKADSLNLKLLSEYLIFLFENKIYDEAINIALKILALDKQNEKAENILFKSYLAKDNKEEAVKAGARLLSAKPDDIELWETMGVLYDGLKQYDKAIEYYQKVLDKQSGNSKVLYKKAVCLVKQNSLVEAAGIFKELKEDDVLTAVYSSLALVLENKYEEALNILTQVLSSDENYQTNELAYVRASLYAFYASAMLPLEPDKIDEYYEKIEIQLLKDNYSETDEQLLAKAIFNYAKIKLAYCKTIEHKLIIVRFIERIINPCTSYFTEKTSSVISDLWLLIAEKQNELELYADALQSLSKAKKIDPDNELIEEKIAIANNGVKKKKQKAKKRNRVIYIVTAILVVLIVTGIYLYKNYKENQCWEKAKTEFTFSSFQNYLNEYPEGKYVKLADSLQEEALWKKAKTESTFAAFQNYLNLYPGGMYVKPADSLRKEALLIEAKTTNNAATYYRFLSFYSKGKELDKAIHRVAKIINNTHNKNGIFIDTRDGHIYKYVTIGKQVWMAENLAYKGSDIKHITDNYEWENNSSYDGWCYYDNDEKNGKTYGVLYQWGAAKKACPSGWHLPNDKEWTQLENYLKENGYSYDGVAGNDGIAKSLATKTGWSESEVQGSVGNSDFPDVRNKTGFSALPGGYSLDYYGLSFDQLGECGHWWSANIIDNGHAYDYGVYYDNTSLRYFGDPKSYGFSIRCVRD